MTEYVAYFRVSTQRQGVSGLGLEAQQDTVRRFLRAGDTVISEFVEVESGKDCGRPQLAAALAACKRRKATLLIAKLDRLARKVSFIATLMDGDTAFVAADNPHASRLTLHVLAAVAEHEGAMISERTRTALQAAKARGVQLGAHGRRFGVEEAQALNAQRSAAAKAWAANVKPIIAELKEGGALTLQAIADGLNGRGLTTPRGGVWRPSTVQRVLAA